MNAYETLAGEVLYAGKNGIFQKLVCSKPGDAGVLRATGRVCTVRGGLCLQLETFHKDGKATHENLPLDAGFPPLLAERLSAFAQVNLMTAAGNAELRRSKKGSTVLLGADKLHKNRALALPLSRTPAGNNKEKNYILDGSEPFLHLLGISDKNGRVYDKKGAKFRQINRFLELVRDTLPALTEKEKTPPAGNAAAGGDPDSAGGGLPAAGISALTDERSAGGGLHRRKIRICDLCCGKSYLSFAVYHYFANILGFEVSMTGVDLKPDVIAACNEVARRLSFNGLEFLCGDVGAYESAVPPDLVVSLHACDTATDLVIGKALGWRARVILSTPCCQHELNRKLNCHALSFLTDYSILRQKFAAAATDALRLKQMEAAGYDVAALELIDPDDTPKNVMLRAVRRADAGKNPAREQKAAGELAAAKAFLLGGS